MYAIVSVPLDCVSVRAVAVVCTRTVAMADVSFAVQTGAELYAVGNVTVAVPDARATVPAKVLAAPWFRCCEIPSEPYTFGFCESCRGAKRKSGVTGPCDRITSSK